MSDCIPFRLYVGEQIVEVIGVLREELRRKGASVTGDDQVGTFSLGLPIGGSLRGSYELSGKSVSITISQRPEVVSCGSIESKMQDFILDARAILKNR